MPNNINGDIRIEVWPIIGSGDNEENILETCEKIRSEIYEHVSDIAAVNIVSECNAETVLRK